jgi:hypothetical protein
MATPADNQKQIDSLEAQIQQIRNTKYPNDPFGAKKDPEILGLRAQQSTLKTQNAVTAPNNTATDAYEGVDRNSGQGVYVNSQTGERYIGPVKETPQSQVTTQVNAENIAEATSKGPVGSVTNTTVPGTGPNDTLSQINTQSNQTAQPSVSQGAPAGTDTPVNASTDPTLSAQQSLGDTGTPTQTLESNFAVNDTGGVPAQSLANIDGDTGFVPQFTGPPSPPPGADPQINDFVFDPISGELLPSDSAAAERVRSQPQEVDDFEFEQQQAERAAREEAEAFQRGQTPPPADFPYGTAVQGRELTDEERQNEDNPDDSEQEIVVGPDGSLTTVTTSRAEAQAQAETLRQAQALQELRAKNTNEDWRLRIGLAPSATYLYKANPPGILYPLRETQGVVFPYTPQISTSYRANYDAYELVHTNYKGYFYKNSAVEEIQISGIFTANSASEADYVLAVIHFFRSASKMFYGQDTEPTAGTPPPVLFMDGLGVYQFNEHPCLLSSFTYSLPSDVDYIRAGGARNYSGGEVNLSGIRNQQGAASNSPLGSVLSRLSTLKNTFDNVINRGAKSTNPQIRNQANFYGIAGQPTYVPTKIQIQISLLPLISRQQQAQEFSLQNYATGQGLREKGFY